MRAPSLHVFSRRDAKCLSVLEEEDIRLELENQKGFLEELVSEQDLEEEVEFG